MPFQCKLARSQESKVISRNKELHFILSADMMSNVPSTDGHALVRVSLRRRQMIESQLVECLRRVPSSRKTKDAQQSRLEYAKEADQKLDNILDQSVWSPCNYTILPTFHNPDLFTIHDQPSLILKKDTHRAYPIGKNSTTMCFIWQGNRDNGWSTVIQPTVWFNHAKKKIYVVSNTNLRNASGKIMSIGSETSALQKTVKNCLTQMTPEEKAVTMKGISVPLSVLNNVQHGIEQIREISNPTLTSRETNVLEYEGYRIDFQGHSYDGQLLERYEHDPEAFDLCAPRKERDLLTFTDRGILVLKTVGRLKPCNIWRAKKSDILRLRSDTMSKACQSIWEEMEDWQKSQLDNFAHLTKDEDRALRQSLTQTVACIAERSLVFPVNPAEAYRLDTDTEEIQPEGRSEAEFPDGVPRVMMIINEEFAAGYLVDDYTI